MTGQRPEELASGGALAGQGPASSRFARVPLVEWETLAISALLTKYERSLFGSRAVKPWER